MTEFSGREAYNLSKRLYQNSAGQVSRHLAEQAESVAAYLLPNGKRILNHWTVGSVNGEEGSSLKIALTGEDAGLWVDHAIPSQKGDLLDLWAEVRGLDLSGALSEARAFLGLDKGPVAVPQVKSPEPPKTPEESAQKRLRSREKAQALWDSALPAISHPYTDKKGLQPTGLRVKDDILLVPMYDREKQLTCVQRIDANPPAGETAKKFLAGCIAKGCYSPIGKAKDETLVVCEGWATGASIHQATGLAVAVAFSSGNLANIAALMRQKHPNITIILAPDNDENRHAIDLAESAAKEYDCLVVYPEFPEGVSGTDFDDLRMNVGLEETRRQLLQCRYQPMDNAPPSHNCKLINLDSVEMEPLEWLWPGRFPLGKLCLLGGKPGVGKTQISLSIAAIVTTGGKWFDCGEWAKPGKVLFLSSEDDIADTVKPRLMAAGADPSKVIVLQSVARVVDEDRVIDGFFSLGKDIDQLKGVLQENPDIRLVILDPLQAYLGAKDAHKNADVREVLGPLSELAARYRVTVLGIEHLGKSAGRVDPMAAFLGSTGIIASARSAYLVCKDNNDEQGDRLFLPVKQNLATDDSGLTFQLVSKTLDPGIQTSCIEWTGKTDKTARDALSEASPNADASAENDAMDFLEYLLKDGPMKSRDVKKQAKEAGIAERTVERAKTSLGYVAKNRGHIYGNAWWWMTPEQVKQERNNWG